MYLHSLSYTTGMHLSQDYEPLNCATNVQTESKLTENLIQYVQRDIDIIEIEKNTNKYHK